MIQILLCTWHMLHIHIPFKGPLIHVKALTYFPQSCSQCHFPLLAEPTSRPGQAVHAEYMYTNSTKIVYGKF